MKIWQYDELDDTMILGIMVSSQTFVYGQCGIIFHIFKYYMRDYSKSYHMTFSSSQILPQCMANCHTQAELWIWIFMVQHNPPECCPCYSLHHSSHHNISMQPITILLTLLCYGRLSLADTRLCRPITARASQPQLVHVWQCFCVYAKCCRRRWQWTSAQWGSTW